jgi:microcin C transport system permease protein
MRDYIIRRLLLAIPTLFGIIFLTFLITRFVPGGPLDQILAELKFSETSDITYEGLTEENLDYLKALYGLDKSWFAAFWDWFFKVIFFDFGFSYRYNEPVASLIIERLPISIYYGIVTTILPYLICIPLGVLKALKNGKWFDNISSIFIFIGYTTPSFVLGLLLIVFFAGNWEWFPIQGFTSDDFSEKNLLGKMLDIIYHSILPTICYVIGSFATMTILVKNSLLENLNQDYIRTAYAKGLKKNKVIFAHGLRNSLVPLAASFGNNISLVFTGSFLIETIFNINGLGLLGFESIQQRDYPVALSIVFFGGVLFLLGNLLSDICLALVDPRIRFT